MPTYNYRCKSCEHKFEEFQKITEDALTECPECGKEIERYRAGKGPAIHLGSSRSVPRNQFSKRTGRF